MMACAPASPGRVLVPHGGGAASRVTRHLAPRLDESQVCKLDAAPRRTRSQRADSSEHGPAGRVLNSERPRVSLRNTRSRSRVTFGVTMQPAVADCREIVDHATWSWKRRTRILIGVRKNPRAPPE